jgi:hypothetical protein
MDKIYLPMQVKALLPSDVYKVLDALMTFQKEGGTITYSKRNAEFLHLPVEITDQAIQTAINYNLIKPIEMSGGVYKFKINQTAIEVAKAVPLTKIPNNSLLKLADEIKFKQEMGTKQPSTEALLEQIRQLQAQLMTQVKNENNEGNDGLPW